MNERLQNVAAVILAISLAAERLVTIAKTLFPRWLGQERLDVLRRVDPVLDRGRRIAVIALSIACAYVTTGLMKNEFRPFAPFVFDPGFAMPVMLVAILASGGSAMWGNLLGYSKAVKDIRSAESGSRYRTTVRHPVSDDAPAPAAPDARAASATAGWDQMLADLHARPQPQLQSTGGRP